MGGAPRRERRCRTDADFGRQLQPAAAGAVIAIYADALARSGGRLRDLFLDLALQFQRPRREIFLARLQKEGIETAIMVDRFQRIRADAEPHLLAERVARECHRAEVRQEPALGLDVRVAHLVAHKHGLSGEFAAPGHRSKPSKSMSRNGTVSRVRPNLAEEWASY